MQTARQFFGMLVVHTLRYHNELTIVSYRARRVFVFENQIFFIEFGQMFIFKKILFFLYNQMFILRLTFDTERIIIARSSKRTIRALHRT